MRPDEILVKIVSKAFDDFDIPNAERADFKDGVADMFDAQAMLAPIDTTDRFRHVLAAYSEASKRGKAYRNVPIVDAACYAAEMCLAVHYAESRPFLRHAVNIALGSNERGGNGIQLN